MSERLDFETAFKSLTGNPPFPWQRDLYDNWFSCGRFPDACTLPTGLGKTSVLAVWLIALATGPDRVPRRLVYVVNRRTVVDQTTTEAEKLRKNAEAAGVPVPAISTLRGQFADNREWSADPSRPAIIAGTVDMIGSRLLFSGYGCGFKTRPLHAGFLGQDVLLVHDEAHLEPAFQTLVEAIRNEQQREAARRGGSANPWPDLRVMALTATPRTKEGVFGLGPADRDNATVMQRLGATKQLDLHPLADAKKLTAELVKKALAFKDSGRAILVFARSVEVVQQVVDSLRKDKALAGRVVSLTGTLRGRERDELAIGNKVFARFLPPGSRVCAAQDGTVYLVCTSAGEVGVNLSADHLVCDLTPFDSMAQRFGRVNRFGDRTDTEIHVFHQTFDPEEPLGPACEQTLALLNKLHGDASPEALGKLDDDAKLAAFTPTPTLLSTTDILLDAWALTTVRGLLPGRPAVEPYLHGLAGWEPPETHVAWRQEVEVVKSDLLTRYKPAELLEAYPLKPHELLRDRSDRVFKQLAKLKREPDPPVWLVDDAGAVTVIKLGQLLDAGKDAIAGKTVLLPEKAGGLANGFLAGDSPSADDVADKWYVDQGEKVQRRVRLWDDAEPPDGMRLVLTVDTKPDADEVEEQTGQRYWHWYELADRGDDEGSKASRGKVTLAVHTGDVVANAKAIAARVLPGDRLGELLVIAAELHDLGKKRAVFQRLLGNFDPGGWLAKSDRKGVKLAETYRHEFGSLLDAARVQAFLDLTPDEQELVLHLIAAHHGRGRPHFPAEEAFDPERPAEAAEREAREVPRRFGRLQRKYGRWGLAYLESLLRAADYAASAWPSEVVKEVRS